VTRDVAVQDLTHTPYVRDWRWVVVALAITACGLGLRFTYLDVPPLDFHATRQYRSALIARAWSGTALQALEPSQRETAVIMGSMEAIEPPVMERLAVVAYALAGREDLRLPRLLSIVAWTLASMSAAWLVVLSGAPGWASLVTLALVWLLPYGIDASRAFMPDPLMVGLLMLSLALLQRPPSVPGRLLLIAALGAASYVKPMAGLMAAPAIVFVDVSRLRGRGVMLAGGTLALAAVPTLAYYATLMAASDSILVNRFYPQLWAQPSFWLDWLTVMIDRVIGLQALLVGLAGVIVSPGATRPLLAGAWLGYVLMGLVFPHHIHTHDYYSLPLIPLVAASVGAGLPALLSGVGISGRHRPVVAAGVVAGLLLWTLRTPEGRRPWGRPDLARERADDFAQIGRLVGHSPRVATLDGDYGYSLGYHGLLGARQLSMSFDRALAALSGQVVPGALSQLRGVNADYFVGTVYAEVAAEPDLQQWLAADATLLARKGESVRWRYVVYDIRPK